MKRTLRRTSSEPASFQFLVADEKIEQSVKSFKVKIPAAGTHTRLDDLAKIGLAMDFAGLRQATFRHTFRGRADGGLPNVAVNTLQKY